MGIPFGYSGLKTKNAAIEIDEKKAIKTAMKPTVCRNNSGLMENEARPLKPTVGDPMKLPYFVSPDLLAGRE